MDTPGPQVPFGRYVLKERLAQGGMGEVFRAAAIGEHGFEKPVVVKRVLPAHAGREDLTDLFVAEAKLMTRLAHPNIVEVYDFGRGEHKDYYLVLELVDGVDLGRLLRAHAQRGEPVPVSIALFVAAQVLRGLHHAHTRLADEGFAIVHRDVSPSNVLLSTEGEVKVADFGIALVQREALATGGIAGKPGYMAPEQFDGHPVDARADVFSVGVVLHQMIAGELPFTGDTPLELQAAARRGDRAKALAARPEAGDAVEAVIARALAPDPAARFPSARAMAQAIEALRDAGHALATADDLADAVRAAKRALPPEGRRVIALSSAAPDEDDAEAPRELTRTGGAAGAFTLRFPVRADATTQQAEEKATSGEGSRTLDPYARPEPRTERLAPQDRPAPPPAVAPIAVEEPTLTPADLPDRGRGRAARRAVAGVVVAVALMGAFLFAVRTPPSSAPHSPATTAAPSSAVPPRPSATPIAPPPEPTATSAATAPPSASPSPSVSPSPHPSTPRASAAPVASPTTTPSAAATSTAKDDDCTGKVHFSSDDSWDIAGGPSRTQTPGVVMWRCGTYTLTARYRPDPTQTRSVTVRVRPDQTAEVSLRLP